MKFRFQEYRRRIILPLAGLALAAYYLLVFLPLGRRAESLDSPLQKAWEKLGASLEAGQTNVSAIDFLRITNQINETRQALGVLETAKKQATARIQWDPSVRARMNAPFQLVEYQNELGKEIDDLSSLAKTQKVVIEPAVFAGFPEHTGEVRQPSLLWPALAAIDGLLRTAFECHVSTIHSLEAPLGLTNAPPTNALERLAEIPLEIEFTASATNATRLLRCLPLRAEEIRAAGLPEAPPEKPVLFVDRLIVRKQAPDKPDEVRVSLRAVGFVMRD
ncbi:MAG TPA: hypothetical protein VMU04_03325 [Candidatus Acidoferrum sp.]|nr:hypothetical protein [Candidatus Acidoferrum sp.]